jgi:hypothetical protein
MSQRPAAPRHSTEEGWKTSVGHAAELPVQLSATSQVPAEPRHSVPEGTKLSAGQSVLDPSQLSATSQVPAAARHWVPEGSGVWMLQLPDSPAGSHDVAAHPIASSSTPRRHPLRRLRYREPRP